MTQTNLGAALQTLGGRESGTARLEEAVAAYREALKERTRGRVPLDWAMTQTNLGAALQALGERESGTARLEEAVAVSREAAKLDLGEELPAVVEHVIEQVGAASAGDNDPAAMLGFVADLVKQVDGDAFALFSCLNETSVGVPDESRAAMGMALLFSGEAAAAEASIGWLL